MKYICLVFLIIFIIIAVASLVQGEQVTIDNIIPSIIAIESIGDPNAFGNAGEIGLMQISPIVYTEWERSQKVQYAHPPHDINIGRLYTPSFNVKIGTWYLRRLKDHYIPKDKYSIEVLLSSYNAGPTRMRKLNWDWKKAPKSTRLYIKKVLTHYHNAH